VPFYSKLAKSAHITQAIFVHQNWFGSIKEAEFCADSKYVEKGSKSFFYKSCTQKTKEKSAKSDKLIIRIIFTVAYNCIS